MIRRNASDFGERHRPVAIYQSFTPPLDTLSLRFVLWGRTLMPTDMPAALADMPAALVDQPPEAAVETSPATSEWAETALTVLFTAAAVLFVSFLAVVTGLV
jgi:hypothetical protein